MILLVLFNGSCRGGEGSGGGYDMLRMWADTCVSSENLTPFVVGGERVLHKHGFILLALTCTAMNSSVAPNTAFPKNESVLRCVLFSLGCITVGG